MFTQKQIEAAALAYVRARHLDDDNRAAQAWADAYPQHFHELKERMRSALEAAQTVELS